MLVEHGVPHFKSRHTGIRPVYHHGGMVGCNVRPLSGEGIHPQPRVISQPSGRKAMAMKLSGATDSTIMRIGRWASLTYLTYIHSQIGALSTGVAWKMSREFTFQNDG
jgi:hypothetical protein